MSTNCSIYTGELLYRKILFTFVFEGITLRLIPPKERNREVDMWFMKPLGNGAYTFGNPFAIETDVLTGRCYEDGQKILFFPAHSYIGHINNVLHIRIDAYVIHKFERESIDRLGFMSPEIDCLYPANHALECIEKEDDGVFSVRTKGFEHTRSSEQCFCLDGKTVFVHFGITRKISTQIGKPPLELHSVMFFEFEPTDDFSFVLKAWHTAKCFMQYLCYRKNVSIAAVDLSAPLPDDKHESFATLHIVEQIADTEPETLEQRRYIRIAHLDGSEGKILNEIAEGKIYTRHLPESFKDSRVITAARFVMITAAFEWTFRKNYPEGISKSSQTVRAEQTANDELQQLLDKSTGKLKSIYGFLKKLIGNSPLSAEIVQIGKDYAEIINLFGQRLYSNKNESFDYGQIGKRLSEQRNNFAHGNLDKDFIGPSLLDLIFLERVIYAMQLKEYGVSSLSIQRAINDLFSCHLAI